MGAVLSCCQEGDNDENEALLASQQNGYGDGNGEDYNTRQNQMKLHEERMQARDEALKEIVSNTNDKLIDISMISNSGIVVQGLDINQCQNAFEQSRQLTQHLDKQNNNDSRNNTGRYIVMDTNKYMSDDMKEKLKELHNAIFVSLDEQLHEESPENLIVSLKK